MGLVETKGVEPSTSAMPLRRSSQLSYVPVHYLTDARRLAGAANFVKRPLPARLLSKRRHRIRRRTARLLAQPVLEELPAPFVCQNLVARFLR